MGDFSIEPGDSELSRFFQVTGGIPVTDCLPTLYEGPDCLDWFACSSQLPLQWRGGEQCRSVLKLPEQRRPKRFTCLHQVVNQDTRSLDGASKNEAARKRSKRLARLYEAQRKTPLFGASPPQTLGHSSSGLPS